MEQLIGAGLLGLAIGLVAGMFIGERWHRWDEKSRQKYTDQLSLANRDLNNIHRIIKREAD